MRRIQIALILAVLLFSSGHSMAPLRWTDPDGDPDGRPFVEITTPSGALTDDGDGTATLDSSSGDAPNDADYLVGTANASLSSEIVAGTAPGGELGGTWGSPTVDSTHAGSAHHSAVTLSGSPDYITISGQDISRGTIDIGDDTNLAGTANQVILTGDTLSTPQDIATTSDVTFHDLLLSGSGPDLTLAQTGGDTYGLHTEGTGSGSQLYLKNNTDQEYVFLMNGVHQLFIGGTGDAGTGVPAIHLMTDGTGNSEVWLPFGSIGIDEIDSISAPTDGEIFSFDSETNRGDWIAAHDAVTVTDTSSLDLTLTGQDIQGTVLPAGVDHGSLAGLADDDHTQYRLESADHSHQSTGLQAGTLDHGLSLTGLTDDDHTQYRLESADHSHQSTGAEAGQLDHGSALTGLTDDDHTQYALLAGRSGGQILIGGTGTTDDLTLRSTSGIGAAGADIILQVGNNGATEAMRILNSGNVGIGDSSPDALLDVGDGTNDTLIAATGVTFTGTAKPDKQVYIGAEAFDCRTTAGCSAGSKQETSTNRVIYTPKVFANDADDFAQVRWQMPDDYDGGTITYQVIWGVDPAETVSGGGVAWFLQGMSIADNDVFDTAFGTAIEQNDDFIAETDIHISAKSAAVTISGSPVGGDAVWFQLYRDVDDTDDDLTGGSSNVAWLVGLRIWYTSDALDQKD